MYLWLICGNLIAYACRKSSSCTHVSGLLHALVAMFPHEIQTNLQAGVSNQEDLPVTSYPCQWNVPRKRKVSSAKITDVSFNKHVYGREKKHTLKPLSDFDPRPSMYRGSASDQMPSFLSSVKGKNLGVSVLFDPDTRVWATHTEELFTPSCVPSRDELLHRVAEFKSSLNLSAEAISQVEQDTIGQSQSPAWFSARRYRLTASSFGKVVHRLSTTPPDALVKQLLHPHQFSSTATEWGKQYEPVALQAYIDQTGVVVTKAGFVISTEYPFLGASPDGYVHDSVATEQSGLVEIKCPYKFRNQTPENAASDSSFYCSLVGECLQLKVGHNYYCQIQGQMAVTKRSWCDFVVYTTRGIAVERLYFDPGFWSDTMLPKLADFYNNCLCPAIVSPIHLVGMKMHDLRLQV